MNDQNKNIGPGNDDYGRMQPMDNAKPMGCVPRRNRIDLCTPAENAIRSSVMEVERLGANEKLTAAVIMLEQARILVADYVDSQL